MKRGVIITSIILLSFFFSHRAGAAGFSFFDRHNFTITRVTQKAERAIGSFFLDPVRSRARDKVASPEDRGAATSNGVETDFSQPTQSVVSFVSRGETLAARLLLRGQEKMFALVMRVPNLSLPDISLSNISLPDISFPNVSLPRIAWPHVSLPNVSLPDISFPMLPEFSVPNIALPSFSFPRIISQYLSYTNKPKNVGLTSSLPRVVAPVPPASQFAFAIPESLRVIASRASFQSLRRGSEQAHSAGSEQAASVWDTVKNALRSVVPNIPFATPDNSHESPPAPVLAEDEAAFLAAELKTLRDDIAALRRNAGAPSASASPSSNSLSLSLSCKNG